MELVGAAGEDSQAEERSEALAHLRQDRRGCLLRELDAPFVPVEALHVVRENHSGNRPTARTGASNGYPFTWEVTGHAMASWVRSL